MPGNTPILEWPTVLGGDEVRNGDDTLRSAFAAIEASIVVGSGTRSKADLPELYPKCTSLMQLSTDGAANGGWDYGSGAILTMRRSSGDVAWQFYLYGSLAAGPLCRMRIGSASGWSDWQRVIAPGLAKAEASGIVTATTTGANEHQTVAVQFPAGRFTQPPDVLVGLRQTPATTTFWVMAEAITAEGFTAHFFRSSAGPIGATWYAVGGIG